MQFSVALRHFREAFSVVGKVVPTRAVNPIMQSVRMTVTDDGLVFAATDNLVSILHRLSNQGTFKPVQVETPGVVLLPKSLIEPVLKVASGDALAFALEGTKLTIRSGSAKWTLQTENPDLFPDVPDFNCAAYHTLAIADFKRLMRRTVYATDPVSTQYALGGVLVEYSGNGSLSFAATDGRVVAVQEVPTSLTGEYEEGQYQRVIPESTLNILGGMLDGEWIDCGFTSLGLVQFRFGDTVLTSRLCEGRFPAWRRAVPPTCNQRFSTEVGPYRAAVEQASVFQSDESRRLSFDYSADGLRIKSVAADVGGSDVEFPLGWEGEPFGIDLRPDYLMKMLSPFDKDILIDCEFLDNRTSVVIRTGDGFFGMVAPLIRGG